MSKKNYHEGVDPRTGEYFYHDNMKPKPRPPDLYLSMDIGIKTQLPSKVFPQEAQRLENLREAYNTLLEGGCLPKNRARGVQRQIIMKAQRAMKVYREKEIRDCL